MIDKNNATGSASELRPNTIGCFEGGKVGIDFVRILPGEEKGPLYRVDTEDFVIWQHDRTLRLNPDKIWYSRTDEIRKYTREHSDKIKNMSCLEPFLENNEGYIEFDTDFRLLPDIKKFFIEDAHLNLDCIYQKVSPGRWAGYDRPRDFIEADKFYCLSHLRLNKSDLYLFQFNLKYNKERPSFNPGLFCGQAKNGTKQQVRLNNHAVRLISNLHEITNGGWPYKPSI